MLKTGSIFVLELVKALKIQYFFVTLRLKMMKDCFIESSLCFR